jgi:hypothetical protein
MPTDGYTDAQGRPELVMHPEVKRAATRPRLPPEQEGDRLAVPDVSSLDAGEPMPGTAPPATPSPATPPPTGVDGVDERPSGQSERGAPR